MIAHCTKKPFPKKRFGQEEMISCGSETYRFPCERL
jgi:hypothetical protein